MRPWFPCNFIMRLLYSASYNILIFIHFTIESFVDKDIIKLPLMDAATWTQQVEAGTEWNQNTSSSKF